MLHISTQLENNVGHFYADLKKSLLKEQNYSVLSLGMNKFIEKKPSAHNIWRTKHT